MGATVGAAAACREGPPAEDDEDEDALKFIRLVRNRKGLIVDSHKIVVAAEKQRYLARKK